MSKNFALGRLKQGVMNATEKDYADLLERQRISGGILWYKFEGIKLRLADATFYSPDFSVMTASNELEMHEVKGYWQDDAKVKIKVASDLYPFRFVAVTKRPKKAGGGWEYVEY